MADKQHKKHRERSFWMTFWIVLFMLQSIFYAILVNDLINRDVIARPVLLGLLVLVTVADIVALTAIWFWKRWGWYVFVISTGLSIVVGLVATASQLSVFHEIMPLVILGWVYREKQDQFD